MGTCSLEVFSVPTSLDAAKDLTTHSAARVGRLTRDAPRFAKVRGRVIAGPMHFVPEFP
jgi:hypothetical protein